LQNYTKESSEDRRFVTSAPWVMPVEMKLLNKTRVWTNLKPLRELLVKQVGSTAASLKFQ